MIPIIELNSTATLGVAAASLPYPEYHPEVTPTSEEDLSKEHSFAASCALHGAKSGCHFCRIDVLSRNPCIIRTPFVHQVKELEGADTPGRDFRRIEGHVVEDGC